MARVSLRVGGEPVARDFSVNGVAPDFQWAAEPIQAWGAAPIKERFLDLLDIASAVFAADGMIERGQLSRPEFGARWGRKFHIDIDVRDTRFWRRPDTIEALAEMLTFLLEHEISFNFRTAAAAPPLQKYFPFSERATQLTADHVVLFSGGLDSLAGALETLSQEDGRIVLVTHRSAPKNAKLQDALANSLRKMASSRIAYIPILATRKGGKPKETTQRSRSFLFAAFGFVIARISGVSRLTFFENGVVSQNLPLSPQIVGAMATRTTHPKTLRMFARLFSLVAETAFEVRNPFQWNTKTEVLEKIRQESAAHLIKDTVSCNHVWRRTGDLTHCGACSQCLDRRFAVLAAGLGEYDPEASYKTPVLLGDRERDRSQIEAVEWVRHALRLDRMGIAAFQNRFGGDLSRIAHGHPHLDPMEVVKRAHDLQRRHGRAVAGVIAAQVRAEGGAISSQTLPGRCLLRSTIGDLTTRDGIPEIDIADWLALPGIDDAEATDEKAVIILEEKNGRRVLRVHDLGVVPDAPAGPAFALHAQYELDNTQGLDPHEHRYVRASDLTPHGGKSSSAVVQNVKRCREQLAALYEEINGEPPPEPLVIQSRRKTGYRLDPYAVVIRTSR